MISGDVQGVGFRGWAKHEADKLGLSGWVKNRDDGMVEAVFQGEEQAVKKMTDLCHRGPLTALVECVDSNVREVDAKMKGFAILYK